MRPSVIVLAYNSGQTLEATLRRALIVSDDVHVVDSFSTDDTCSIALMAGAFLAQHPFESYGAQRNWSMGALPIRYRWQLHLDADEWMDDELIWGIQRASEGSPQNGFLLARYLRFLGRTLRHGGMSPTWHLRLFRSGQALCEDRKYDQHFYLLTGTTERLPGSMIDDIQMSLSEWTFRHNRWSDSEVEEQRSGNFGMKIQGNLAGNAIEKKRYWRERYDHAPLFARPFALFLYRYVLRLGFLDGKEGFIFWTLQTFWFRFLVDAKLFEARLPRQQFSDEPHPVLVPGESRDE